MHRTRIFVVDEISGILTRPARPVGPERAWPEPPTYRSRSRFHGVERLEHHRKSTGCSFSLLGDLHAT